MKKLTALVHRCLKHPLLPFGLALLAVLLCTPSLSIGWILDDDFHRAALTAPPELPELARPPAEIFAFIGERWTRRSDLLPWWTSDELRIAFFRPVTAFTHWLDYRLWPEEPMWMHLQSLLWLGLTVAAAALLYRRLAGADGALAAGLAALFFAIDDAHGMPAVWIANRNALVAVFFSLLTLAAYHHWRAHGWRPGAVAVPALLLLAVLSAESAVACGAYLLSYALFLDRGPLRQRLTALLPSAAAGVVWYFAHQAAGYGVGGGGYLDPAAEPGRFLGAVAERGPIQLWGLLGFPASDVYNFFSQPAARLVWLAALILLAVIGLPLLVPLLRRDRRARFWTFGMLLALVPSCVTAPTLRLLIFASLGSAGLLAVFVVRAWRRDAEPAAWRRVARIVSVPLLLIHLVQAPLGLATTGANMAGVGGLFMKAAASLPSDPAVSAQQAVIVNAPTFFPAALAPVHQALRGRPVPTEILTLATGLDPIEVRRSGPRTLTVRPHGGIAAPAGSAPPGTEPEPFNFFYAFQMIDAMYRDPEPFRVGQRFERRRLRIEVVAVTADARPAEVRFDFDAPLEDASWRWLQWRDGGYANWQPPAVGETVTLEALTW